MLKDQLDRGVDPKTAAAIVVKLAPGVYVNDRDAIKRWTEIAKKQSRKNSRSGRRRSYLRRANRALSDAGVKRYATGQTVVVPNNSAKPRGSEDLTGTGDLRPSGHLLIGTGSRSPVQVS